MSLCCIKALIDNNKATKKESLFDKVPGKYCVTKVQNPNQL